MEAAGVIGERLIKEGRFEEALPVLDAAIAASPDDPGLYLLRANARHFGGSSDRQERRRLAAEDLKKSAAAGRSTYSEAAVQACSLLFHWAYKDEAEEAVRATLGVRPDDGAQAHYQRARFLERFRSDHEAALEEADHSISIKPHWRSYLFRAKLHVRMASYEQAGKDLESCLTLNPSAREALLARARLRTKLADAVGAAGDFERAFAIAAPARFEEWMESAQAHLENQEPQKAVADFGKAIDHFEVAPPDILYRRAQARRRADDVTGALADLDEAIRADESYEPARTLRAQLLKLC